MSLNSIYNNANYALNLHSQALMRLQEQASTGSHINRASDAPSDAYRVLELNSQVRSLENYMKNLVIIDGTLGTSSTAIQQMNDITLDVKLEVEKMSGTSIGIVKSVTIESLNEMLKQMYSLSNSKYGDQYLFGGGNGSSVAYSTETTDGKITRVNYVGSDRVNESEVAPEISTAIVSVGDELFHSDNRGDPEFIMGNTGVAAGATTSTVTGFTWLEVTDAGGGNYNISIDGGLTTVLANGTSNQAITNSETGEVLYLDTTGITGTGTDLVSISGTHDVFNSLITVRQMFEKSQDFDAVNGFTDSEVQTLLQAGMTALTEVESLLVQGFTSVGSKQAFLDDIATGLDRRKFETASESSRLEESDIAQIAVDLSRREVLYQMSLSVAGRLLSLSLMDYM